VHPGFHHFLRAKAQLQDRVSKTQGQQSPRTVSPPALLSSDVRERNYNDHSNRFVNLRKIFAWMLAASCLAAASSAAAAASKPLLVHYMPWYAAKPYSASWGWHWTMNHYRPDVTEASGRRQIASHYYPVIGPYDSADPAVLEYHVLLMKLAGIDGVIVDWYGPSACPGLDYGALNENTGKLFAYTRKAGLKFSICYEDQSIQHMIESGHLASDRALSQAQQAMLYLQSNFWSHSSYFQLDNKPVLLNFGPRYFKNNSQWRAIFSPLPASNSPAFFTEDHKYPVGTGAFPWPPMWLTEAGSKKLAPDQVDHYLAGFYASGKDWAASVGGAWPRFHDIYAEAGGRPSYGFLEDRNG